ncbi:MAG: 50S ribosomal protein L14 [Thermoplasmata archaeon]|jgi:large subunit ribosomal protein L14|nr:50S ribosomal protein L14 [Thermoplasmata archaeon]
MKGLAGRRGRGLPKGARLDVVDNTGAKVIEIISVHNWHGTHRRYPRAGIADLIIASVKKGTPDIRKQVVHAIIVRSRSPIRRADGTRLMFEDNAAVITTETGEIKGSQIKGPVAKEAAERWPRIAAASSIIV